MSQMLSSFAWEVVESHQLKLNDLNNGFLFEEIAFGLFELESGLFQLLEDDLNVSEMFMLILDENEDVIQIGHCKITTVLQNN